MVLQGMASLTYFKRQMADSMLLNWPANFMPDTSWALGIQGQPQLLPRTLYEPVYIQDLVHLFWVNRFIFSEHSLLWPQAKSLPCTLDSHIILAILLTCPLSPYFCNYIIVPSSSVMLFLFPISRGPISPNPKNILKLRKKFLTIYILFKQKKRNKN